MMMSVQSDSVCRIVSCISAAVSESNDDVASSNTTIYIIATLHYRVLLPAALAHITELFTHTVLTAIFQVNLG